MQSKTIAVNTRLLIRDRLDGIGWFTYHTLQRITQEHPEHQFIFIFDRPFDPSFIFSSNVTPVVAGPQARHPFLFYWWFEKVIPRVLKKYKADLFLSPDGYLSIKTEVPSLPVIHDLNFHHHPEYLPWLVRHYYNQFFPRFAWKASRICTVSEYSKNDIATSYGIEPGKIDVVYNGAATGFKPATEEEKSTIRNRFTSGKPYFLFVGTIHPRKNLINQLHAFALFSRDFPDHRFIIAGDAYYKTGEVKSIVKDQGIEDRVIFTGRLGSTEIAQLMSAAEALMYVSHFEGFGIPIIEAFAAETPVITAPVTSLPEIAGDAALYADPDSPQQIALAMKELIQNVEKRSALIQKGRERKNNFTWDKSAALLWASIERTLHAKEILP